MTIIKFRCPSCQKMLGVNNPQHFGKQIKCPACKQLCNVPEKPLPAPPAAAQTPAVKARPQPAPPTTDEFDSDSRPSKSLAAAPVKRPIGKKKSRSDIDGVTLLCVLVGVGVVAGAAVIRYTDLLSAPPQVKVAARKPGTGVDRERKPPTEDPLPVKRPDPDETPTDPKLSGKDKPEPKQDPKLPKPEETLKGLLARLEKQEPEERAAAVKALGELGDPAHPAVPRLIALLDDSNAEVKEAASRAIVAIGRKPLSGMIDFSATWCGPCRQMKPIVTRLEKEGLPILEVDTDKNPQLSSHFKIRFIPTFVLIRDDKEIDRTTGTASEEYLRGMLKDLAKTNPSTTPLTLEDTAGQARLMSLLLCLSGEDAWLRFVSEEALKAQGPKAASILVGVSKGKYPNRLRLGAMKAVLVLHREHKPSAEVAQFLKERAGSAEASTDVRGYAAVALHQLKIEDPQTVPTLTAALEKGTPAELRELAAISLGELQATGAIPTLAERLGDESVRAKRAAARALGMMAARSGQAVPALLAAYEKDTEEKIREDVKQALEQIVPSAKEAVPALVKVMQSKVPAARLLALELLNVVDDPQLAATALGKMLEDNDSSVRIQAAIALQRIDQEDAKVLQVLVGSLKEEKENFEATQALMTAGRKGTPFLMKCVVDPASTPRQRLRATRLLTGRDKPGKADLAGLTEALKASPPEIPICAALVLVRATPKNPQLIKPLAEGLKSKDKDLRGECMRALGATGSPAAVAALLAVLKEDAELRDQAAQSLSGLERDEKTVAELVGLLRDPEKRLAAARALAELPKHQELAVPALITALASAEEEEREVLSETLGTLGKSAIPLLMKLVEDASKKEDIRLQGLTILSRMGEEARDAAPGLMKYLKDPSKRIQMRVAITLARLGADADVVGLLLEALQMEDQNSPLRSEAQSALASLGPRAASSLDRLLEWLNASDKKQRDLAINLLPQVGRDSPRAVSSLVALLKSAEDQNVRRSVSYSLSGFGEKGAAELLKALADPAYSRPDVIVALQNLGPQAKSATKALTLLLQDKDRSVAIAAALALAHIDPKQEAAVPVLLEGAQSQDRGVRDQSLAALGTFGPLARGAVPMLVRAIDDRETRSSALYALGRIGPDATEAVGPLVRLLNSRDQQAAATALGAIGPAAAAAVPRLLRMLQNERTMHTATAALSKIGGEARQAVPLLVARLSAGETVIPVCWALGQVGSLDLDKALPAIRKLAASPEIEIRATAIRTLGQLRSDKVVNDLLEAMKDTELDVRLAAVGSLGQLGPRVAAAVPVLTQVLEGKEPALQEAAAGALGNFKDAAAPAVPALIKALDNKQTRNAAAYSLARIGAKAETAIPRLVALLDDPEGRYSAVGALGQFGQLAKAALPKLKALVKDRDAAFGRAAAATISRIEGKEVGEDSQP